MRGHVRASRTKPAGKWTCFCPLAEKSSDCLICQLRQLLLVLMSDKCFFVYCHKLSKVGACTFFTKSCPRLLPPTRCATIKYVCMS